MNKKIILSLVAIAVIIPVLGIGMMPDNVDADKIGKEFAANYPESTIITSPIEEQISEQEEINRAQLIREGVILEENPIIVDSATSESVTFQPTTVSAKDSVPYSPYSSLDNPVVSGEPSIPGYFEIKLSNLPLLNEVVNMTITVENISKSETTQQVAFVLEDGWRFVNVQESQIEEFHNDNFGTTYRMLEDITVDFNEKQSFTKQVIPTELGTNILQAFALGKADTIALQIGENRTITLKQHYEENPELAPWNIVKEPKICVYEDCEPVPDLSRNSTGTGTTVPTPEQEEYIKEYWKQTNNTSVDSVISENVILQGNTVSAKDSVPYSPTSGNEEPSIGVLSAELSNIPLLNEIINVTAVIQNTHYNENAKLVFILRDGWEFVNVPESEIRTLLDNENKTVYHTYGIITVGLGEFQTFTKQVKPTQLGKSIVRVVAPDSNANVGIGLFIGENRTLTTAQYWEENPELNPWNIEREPEVCLNKWCEPEPRPMEEYTGTPDEDTTEYTDDEHFNETRKKQGLPPINNTSINNEPW